LFVLSSQQSHLYMCNNRSYRKVEVKDTAGQTVDDLFRYV